MTDKSPHRGSMIGHLPMRRWLPVGVLLFLLCLVYGFPLTPHAEASSGEWPSYMMDNARTGFNKAEHIINPTTVQHLKLHWTQKTPRGISAQPTVAHGRVYWGSWDGNEHGTLLNGSQSWTTNLGKTTDPACVPPSVGVASTATLATTVIHGASTPVDYVGGGSAAFYALNADTGAILWRTPLGAPPSHFLWSSPAVYQGNVYVGMASFGDCPLVPGKLIKMDAATGAIKNTFNIVPPGCVGGGIWSSPAIDEATGTIYVSTGNPGRCSASEPFTNAVLALNASNLTLLGTWQIPAGEQTADGDFGATPTLFTASINGVAQNLVGVVNKNGIYYTFKRSAIGNGPLWRTRIAQSGDCPQCGSGGISPSAWDGQRLYVAGGSRTIGGINCRGSVNALRPATGAVLWSHCLMAGPVLGSVTAVPGLVIVAQGTDFNIIAAQSGKTLFSYHDGHKNSFFAGGASVSNGVLYIGNLDGFLYAFGV